MSDTVQAQVGDTVQVPLSGVEKGSNNLIHVLACKIKKNKNYMTYQLASIHGIIQGMHSRNTLHIIESAFFENIS